MLCTKGFATPYVIARIGGPALPYRTPPEGRLAHESGPTSPFISPLAWPFLSAGRDSMEVGAVVIAYGAAWNEPDGSIRRELLESA
jgi:hypothetical protein